MPGGRAPIMGLDQDRMRRSLCELAGQIVAVCAAGHDDGARRRDLKAHLLKGAPEQRFRSNDPGELFWAFVAAKLADKLAQAKSFSAGKHDRPQRGCRLLSRIFSHDPFSQSESILCSCDLRYPMRRGRNFRSPGLRSHEQPEKRDGKCQKEIESPVKGDAHFSFQTR